MPYKIIWNDISLVKADAIVNTANPKPRVGTGVDFAIYREAHSQEVDGQEESLLLEERKAIGNLQPGEVEVTRGYNLKAEYIIHAVGPVWQGGDKGEKEILLRTYINALEKAASLPECNTVAFPLISAGRNGFPEDVAICIAINAFTAFCLKYDIQIILVVFKEETYELAKKVQSVSGGYVDQTYINAAFEQEYKSKNCVYSYQELKKRLTMLPRPKSSGIARKDGVQTKNPAEERSKRIRAAMFNLIKEKGFEQDSEVYKRAGISKQLFHKMRCQNGYGFPKDKMLRLAIALELDYDSAQAFLKTAGYTLSESDEVDCIVIDHIARHQYDIGEFEGALEEKRLLDQFKRKKK